MRKIVLPLLLLVLVGCNKDRNDWAKLHLNDDVQEVSEYTYKADVQTSEAKKGALQKVEKTCFDKDGRISTLVLMDDSDTISTTCFFYSSEGKLTEKVMTDAVGQTVRFLFQYDAKGRQVEARVEKEGEVVHLEKTEYNDDNNIETTISYDGKGTYLKKEERKMSKTGFPKEIKIFDEKRELVNFRREEYDQRGNLTDFTVYAADESTPVLQVRRTYDLLGNMLKQEAVDLQSQEAFEPQEYKYILDKKKNWERGVLYVGNEAQVFMEREIIYY